MRFNQLSFVKKEIKVSEIGFGEIVHAICQTVIEDDMEDIEIRIVDVLLGEVEIYENYKKLLTSGYEDGYRVSLYNASIVHNNETEKNFLKIVVADNIE